MPSAAADTAFEGDEPQGSHENRFDSGGSLTFAETVQLQEERKHLNVQVAEAKQQIALLEQQLLRCSLRRTAVAARLDQAAAAPPDPEVAAAVAAWGPHVRDAAEALGKPAPHAWQVEAAAVAASRQRDVFVVAAAGSGKSLVYQSLLLLPSGVGLVLIVEPTLALAQEQCDILNTTRGGAHRLADGTTRPTAIVLGGGDDDNFHERIGALPTDFEARRAATLVGAPEELAECVHAGSQEDTILHWLQVESTATWRPIPLALFVSPEKALLSLRLLALLRAAAKLPLTRGRFMHMVIDECHCMPSHGHEFRPEYLKLRLIRAAFPLVTCILLTATANPSVAYSICELLGVTSPHMVRLPSGSLRSNMVYRLLPVASVGQRRLVLLGLLLEHLGDVSIIYCNSKADCEELALYLQSALPAGEAAAVAFYHAGLLHAQRHERRRAFQRSRIRILIATVAWGMGMDKRNVRHVYHWGIPRSLDAWYQEASRAGRDGQLAENTVLFIFGEWVRSAQMRGGGIGQTALGREYGFAQSVAVLRALLDCDNCRHLVFEHALGDGTADATCHCQPPRVGVCASCREGDDGVVAVRRGEWVDAFESCARKTMAMMFARQGRLRSSEGSITLLAFYSAWVQHTGWGCSLQAWMRRALFACTLTVDGVWTLTPRCVEHGGDGLLPGIEVGGRQPSRQRWILDARLTASGCARLRSAPELIEVRVRRSTFDTTLESQRLEEVARAWLQQRPSQLAAEVAGILMDMECVVSEQQPGEGDALEGADSDGDARSEASTVATDAPCASAESTI